MQKVQLPPLTLYKQRRYTYLGTYKSEWIEPIKNQSGKVIIRGRYRIYGRRSVATIVGGASSGYVAFRDHFYKDYPELRDYVVYRNKDATFTFTKISDLSPNKESDQEAIKLALDVGDYVLDPSGKLVKKADDAQQIARADGSTDAAATNKAAAVTNGAAAAQDKATISGAAEQATAAKRGASAATNGKGTKHHNSAAAASDKHERDADDIYAEIAAADIEFLKAYGFWDDSESEGKPERKKAGAYLFLDEIFTDTGFHDALVEAIAQSADKKADAAKATAYAHAIETLLSKILVTSQNYYDGIEEYCDEYLIYSGVEGKKSDFEHIIQQFVTPEFIERFCNSFTKHYLSLNEESASSNSSSSSNLSSSSGSSRSLEHALVYLIDGTTALKTCVGDVPKARKHYDTRGREITHMGREELCSKMTIVSVCDASKDGGQPLIYERKDKPSKADESSDSAQSFAIPLLKINDSFFEMVNAFGASNATDSSFGAYRGSSTGATSAGVASVGVGALGGNASLCKAGASCGAYASAGALCGADASEGEIHGAEIIRAGEDMLAQLGSHGVEAKKVTLIADCGQDCNDEIDSCLRAGKSFIFNCKIPRGRLASDGDKPLTTTERQLKEVEERGLFKIYNALRTDRKNNCFICIEEQHEYELTDADSGSTKKAQTTLYYHVFFDILSQKTIQRNAVDVLDVVANRMQAGLMLNDKQRRFVELYGVPGTSYKTGDKGYELEIDNDKFNAASKYAGYHVIVTNDATLSSIEVDRFYSRRPRYALGDKSMNRAEVAMFGLRLQLKHGFGQLYDSESAFQVESLKIRAENELMRDLFLAHLVSIVESVIYNRLRYASVHCLGDYIDAFKSRSNLLNKLSEIVALKYPSKQVRWYSFDDEQIAMFTDLKSDIKRLRKRTANRIKTSIFD